MEDGLIDKCPKCGKYKDDEFELCLNCRKSATKKSKYKEEHSKKWDKGDKKADRFYVYILKSKVGKFYVGQTRDLRSRLSEHIDGKTRSTAGKDMKLQYFEEKERREEAARREVELKRLLDTNERQVRKMIIEFKDRINEVG